MVAAVCGLGARAQVYDAINPLIDNVREEQRRQPGCPEVVLDRRGRVTDALLLIESIHGGH